MLQMYLNVPHNAAGKTRNKQLSGCMTFALFLVLENNSIKGLEDIFFLEINFTSGSENFFVPPIKISGYASGRERDSAAKLEKKKQVRKIMR